MIIAIAAAALLCAGMFGSLVARDVALRVLAHLAAGRVAIDDARRLDAALDAMGNRLDVLAVAVRAATADESKFQTMSADIAALKSTAALRDGSRR